MFISLSTQQRRVYVPILTLSHILPKRRNPCISSYVPSPSAPMTESRKRSSSFRR
jgi:hypothetical protein